MAPKQLTSPDLQTGHPRSKASEPAFFAEADFPSINANQTIMSIAAGVTTHSIEKGLGGQPSVIRVMPNHRL